MAEVTAVEALLLGMLVLLGLLTGFTIAVAHHLQLPPRPRRAPRRLHRAPSWCLLWCPRAADSPARPRPAPPTGTEDPKKEELDKEICQEEEEKTKLQNNICLLAKKLAHVNDTLACKMASRKESDKTVAETVAAS